MFRIRWRTGRSFRVVTGLSRYSTTEAANKQVEIWQRLFPQNTYYIELY